MNRSDYVTAESLRAYRAQRFEPAYRRRRRGVWHTFTPGQKALLIVIAIVCFPVWIVVMLVLAVE